MTKTLLLLQPTPQAAVFSLRKLCFLFITILLFGLHACNEDIAEDGTKRGKLVYSGSIEKNGKEFYVFVYSRTEAIESSDSPTVYKYFWITCTLNAQTGKVVHTSTYEVEESGNFTGVCSDFAFFRQNDGIHAIDLHHDNGILKPDALKARVEDKNPALKGKIASLEVDSYRNLRVLTTDGDLYLLATATLKGALIADGLQTDPDYRLSFTSPLYGDVQMLGANGDGYALTDTTTVMLHSLDPNNTHKKYIYVVSHASREDWVAMVTNVSYTKADSAFFLDAYDIGYSDSVLCFTYVSELGANGQKRIGAYDMERKRLLWSKKITELCPPSDDGLPHSTEFAWNRDGSAFLIGELSNNYTPFYLVDARTGKVRWHF